MALTKALLVICCLVLSSCDAADRRHEAEMKQRNARLATLCEGSSGCDAYPEGYHTAVIDGVPYYVPLSVYIWRSYPETIYVQRDPETNRVVRVVDLEETTLPFLTCCGGLGSRLGLELPEGPAGEPPAIYGNELFLSSDYDAHGRRRLPNAVLSSTYHGSVVDAYEALPDDISTLPSYNEDFYLIKKTSPPYRDPISERERLPGEYYDIKALLVSKKPLLLGQHVLLGCGKICHLGIVPTSDDPFPPTVLYTGLRGALLPDCSIAPESACRPREGEWFSATDEIAFLDRVIKTMRRYPALHTKD